MKLSKNINKGATKRKSAAENYILKFLTVSSVSSDSIVKGIIDDIIKTAVKTAEVDEQKTKRKHKQVISLPTDCNSGTQLNKIMDNIIKEFFIDIYVQIRFVLFR